MVLGYDSNNVWVYDIVIHSKGHIWYMGIVIMGMYMIH